MQRNSNLNTKEAVQFGVNADSNDRPLCKCGCGESMLGERQKKLFKTGHKDPYYNRIRKEKIEEKKRLKVQRKQHDRERYEKEFKEIFNVLYYLRVAILLFIERDHIKKMSINLPIEFIRERYNIPISNCFKKWIKEDLLIAYPELKEYLK